MKPGIGIARGLGLAALLAVAGCMDGLVDGVAPHGKRINPIDTTVDPGKPTACIALWDPVCGVDGKTYGNSCEARVAGVAVAQPGECKPPVTDPIKIVDPVDPPTDTCKLGDPGDPDPGDDIVCIALWDPVCGKDGKTYGNACEAGKAKAGIAYEGECKPVTDPVDPGLICTKEYMPVCGVDGKTYGNKCMAGKTPIAHEGECKPATDPIKPGDPGRICTMEYAPVCGTDGKTYSNRCMAGDVPVAHAGECP